MQTIVAGEDFLMKFGINLHRVTLNQVAGGIEITFALDALNFGQQFAKEAAHLDIVIDTHISFALHLDQFGRRMRRLGHTRVVEHPVGHQSAIAHVGFFDGGSGLDAHELGERAVLEVGVVLRFVSVHVGRQTEFHELLIAQIVEGKEVGTCLFDGRPIGTQGVGVGTGEEASAAVSQTFVQVGVQVVAVVAVVGNEAAGRFVDDKLCVHTRTVGGLGIS